MMNHQKGFRRFRSKQPTSCSVCGQLNILTRDCPCRQHVLSNLSAKQICEPLRLFGNPQRLVFDVTITTDVFTVYVNPFQVQSKINGTMLQYLSILRRYPKTDNTIDLEFKFQKLRRSVSCSIDFSMDVPISFGLSGLLNLGMQFSLCNSIVNSNSLMTLNVQNQPLQQLIPALNQNHLGFSQQVPVINAGCSEDILPTYRNRNTTRKFPNYRQRTSNFFKNKKVFVTFANKKYKAVRHQDAGPKRLSSAIYRAQKKSNDDILDVNIDEDEFDSIAES